MSFLIIVPGFISLFLVLRGRIDTAFLSVYLPCLLCLSEGYQIRIPHFPPTSAEQFALIPLGVVALYRLIQSGSFALMDLLALLYTASIGLSEILHAPVQNDGIFSAIGAFMSIFLPYVAGRTLIEPNLRLATVRRFVTLVLLDVPPSMYEWRMGQSLWGIFGQRVLGLTTTRMEVQIRSGHGRLGEVFGGSEPGGIAFAMTFCLNAWLVYLRRAKISLDLDDTLTKFEKYHVPGLVLLLAVLLTQARGPLIALVAAYLILQIPRFKNTRIIMIVVAVLFVAGYFAASKHFAALENLDPTTITEQQGSALYRLEMNRVYPAIAEKGGWTGYSALGIPHVEGMESIDNHYLLVHLAWGRLAYILCVLIVWENLRVLLVRAWQAEALEDRAFIFSMLAAMTVLWLTLMTVFLGGQLPQISFLLIGWTQSVGRPPAEEMRGFSFRRIFT
jgi:O-Antigen ligase